MKKIFTLLTLTLGLLSLSKAQTNTVTGTITDCLGAPVVGHPVYVMCDSTITTYYNTVYTNASGVYTDNVPYNTFLGGIQPIYINTQGFGPSYPLFSATENPTSSGNIFTNDFAINCAPVPLPTNTVEGTILDCAGNPVAGHPVIVYVDSTVASTYYYNVVYTDAAGYYIDPNVSYGGGGLAEDIYIKTNDPYPGSTTYSATESPSSSGNTYTNNFSVACGSAFPCAVGFYSYEDSTGVNDTTYLVLSISSSSPASTTVSWDFGDGTFASGPWVNHVYATNGLYNVCVTIFDASDSCTAIYCDTVADIFRSGFVLSSIYTGATLGLKENTTLTDVKIYPNPAQNEINISSPRLSDAKTIVVYDLVGRPVSMVNNTGNATNARMDISNLENGSYLMVLLDATNKPLYTHTLIKH